VARPFSRPAFALHWDLDGVPPRPPSPCKHTTPAVKRSSPANTRTKGFFESIENVPHDPCFFCRLAETKDCVLGLTDEVRPKKGCEEE